MNGRLTTPEVYLFSGQLGVMDPRLSMSHYFTLIFGAFFFFVSFVRVRGRDGIGWVFFIFLFYFPKK